MLETPAFTDCTNCNKNNNNKILKNSFDCKM